MIWRLLFGNNGSDFIVIKKPNLEKLLAIAAFAAGMAALKSAVQ